MEGWTVIHKPASDEFNARFRGEDQRAVSRRWRQGNMLLAKDPVFVEAVMNPSLMAMAEFSVGRAASC